jgi:HD-GYP domain-containing protein (c-di-GMP phosphodiesterase class II)
MKLGCPVFDAHNTKLLASGIEITQHLLDSLQRRHVGAVRVASADAVRLEAFAPQGRAKVVPNSRTVVIAPLSTSHSRNLDSKLNELLIDGAIPLGPEFSLEVRKPADQLLDRQWKDHLVDKHEEQVAKLDALHDVIHRGGDNELPLVCDAAAQSLHLVREDLDAFVCLSANPAGDNYPSRHSLHTAMLAIAIGSTMGCDEEQLSHLAIGCLIHDIGMVDVDPRTLAAKRDLAPEEFCDITRHPVRTFDLIEQHLDIVPPAARMVAYQMHERFDGSGYPRRREGAQIHKLARIAAVADAYAALVAPRPHREAMLPYHAVARVLKDAAARKYDPDVVRGLLNTISLFPLGSLVELNNGLVGRVIRANGAQYDRPSVEAWTKGKITEQGTLVNLSQEPELKIVRTLDTLSS